MAVYAQLGVGFAGGQPGLPQARTLGFAGGQPVLPQTSDLSYAAPKNVDEMNEMRQHYFQFLSDNSVESKEFMRRFWCIACRFRSIMANSAQRLHEDGENILALVALGKKSEDEARANLIDDFMSEVERWQDRFRKVVVDGAFTLKKIDEWTAAATARFGAEAVLRATHKDDDKDRASEVHHWVKELYLRRLHAFWFLMNPERVHKVILFLGAESKRFMQCLSVHITAAHIVTFDGLFNRVTNRRYQFKGRDLLTCPAYFHFISKDAGEEYVDGKDPEEEVWNKLAPSKPEEQRNQLQKFLNPSPQKVEVEFYWCGIMNLLEQAKIQNISALSMCCETSGVFKPVTSRALFAHHWHHCHSLFLFDRFLDTVSIVALVYIVYQSKHTDAAILDAHGSSVTYMMWLVAGINIITLVQILCEAVIAVAQKNRAWFTAYNLVLVGMELVSLAVLWQLIGIFSHGPLDSMMDTFGLSEDNSWRPAHMAVVNTTEVSSTDILKTMLEHKPMLFCALILFKWMQFLLGFLVFDIGKTVLPAVYAMKSGESTKFVLYMIFVIFACTHAYWSLPMQDGDYEIAGKEGGLITSFFRMFRLCVMGDFDIWELEGIDGEMDASGYVDEPPSAWAPDRGSVANGTFIKGGSKSHFHMDLRVTSMTFGLVLTIMLMNMYIGVLGISYEEFLNIKLEVFSHAKSKFMIRYLLRRHAFRNIIKCRAAGVKHKAEKTGDGIKEGLKDLLRTAKLNENEKGDGFDEEAPETPDGFDESLLVGKNHWHGFWTTVPQDLVEQELDSTLFMRMEDRQISLVDTMDSMGEDFDSIEQMLKDKGWCQ